MPPITVAKHGQIPSAAELGHRRTSHGRVHVSFSAQELAIVGCLLILHLGAVFRLIPPAELFRSDPMIGADQPVHTYNVHMYREALYENGAPWGCDPTLSGGKWMLPVTDAGGRPQAVICALLPSLTPGQVVRIFAFLAALTFPAWQLLVSARLNLPPAARVWSLLVLLSVGWLYPTIEGFFRWGQSAFATASYVSPFVLMAFLGFIAKPSWSRYFGALAGLCVLFLIHVLGPVVIAPTLLGFTLFARPLSLRWRCAAVAAPLAAIAVNSFWFVPFLLAMKAPRPPRPLEWMPPDLVYRSWSELAAVLSPLRAFVMVFGIAIAAVGFAIMRKYTGKRVVIAFAIAAGFGLVLKLFGSFLPVVYLMQPSRFILPAFALLTFPAGVGAYWVCNRLRVPQMPLVGCVAGMLLAGAIFLPKPSDAGTITHVNYAGVTEHHGARFSIELPGPIPCPDLMEPLLAFIRIHTEPDDRLLIQTVLQAEPLIVPLTTGREVIANTYPDAYDLPQFLTNKLFGRPLNVWTAEQLRETLDRWGIQWVFTNSAEAGELLEQMVESPGTKVGRYQAFHVQETSSRFLVGTGHLVATVNRIELSQLEPEDGRVVLRYRYHPAWRASNGTPVMQFGVPEDPVGFIELRDPPPSVTLQFDPWRMLFAPWPDASSRADASLTK